jgi:hypothetical protein
LGIRAATGRTIENFPFYMAAGSHLLAGVSAELASDAENSFSARKPDKMRALSATHT